MQPYAQSTTGQEKVPMELKPGEEFVPTAREHILICRASKALEREACYIGETNGPHSGSKKIIAYGVILPNPLRLQFVARPEDPCKFRRASVIGPQKELTEDLFDGDSLAERFLARFRRDAQKFVRHMQIRAAAGSGSW